MKNELSVVVLYGSIFLPMKTHQGRAFTKSVTHVFSGEKTDAMQCTHMIRAFWSEPKQSWLKSRGHAHEERPTDVPIYGPDTYLSKCEEPSPFCLHRRAGLSLSLSASVSRA